MKKKLFLVVLSMILGFVLYLTLFNMKAEMIPDTEKIEYSETGFVDAMTLEDTDHLAASNDRFELYLDETTSYFTVVDKMNDTEWHSNPVGPDPWQTDLSTTMTQSAINKQKSTLELSYFNETGSLATVNNYTLSISHPATVLYDEGLRTYDIKYVEDGFQVLYAIKEVDIDYLYFPKYLEPEVLESHPDRSLLEAIAYTGYDEEMDVYVITQYEGMSMLVRKRLYDIFYGEGGLGYSRERAIEENESYGYMEAEELIEFKIGIDVRLTDEGVRVSVLRDSISETASSKLASVSLYPLFGTAVSEIDGIETSGSIILPDGSGAVMEFNNGKHYQQPYSKHLYGHDLGMLPHKKPESQNPITIPLYGMVKEDSAFAAIITSGDAMATINADVSGRIDSYNKVYPTFDFRENEAVILGTGFNQYAIDLWTEEPVDMDFTVNYVFLEEEKADYVHIAKAYADYLDEHHTFSSIDETHETTLTMELLGAYEQKDFFMGVPYNRSESMTTFEQAQWMTEAFIERGVDDIDIVYKGMINGGLSSSVANTFDVERVLGGEKGYETLLSYTRENDITVYPSVSLMTADGFIKPFDQFRYAASRLDGKLSKDYIYHLPSKLPYEEAPSVKNFKPDYVVNPLYFEAFFNRFSNRYEGNAIAFETLANKLGGHYGDDLVYRQTAMWIQSDILKKSSDNLLLKNPFGFAYPYVENITDMPMEMTRYPILDYSIPLLQLVLSGKINYSTISLNMSTERTDEYMFLKIIETGSNMKYTLSYDDSSQLKETKHNQYFSTQYMNWIDRIEDHIHELNELGIHEGHLVDHEMIADHVIKVSYSHGLEILINYNLQTTYGILGYDIPPMDYIVMGVE